MRPISREFSAEPPRFEGSHPGGDYAEMAAVGSIAFDFTLDDDDVSGQAKLTVTANSSHLGKPLGHGSADCSDRPLIPSEACGRTRPYRIALRASDEVSFAGHVSGGRERAATESAFVIRTERRGVESGSPGVWQPAPRLLLHLDRGNHSLLAQLEWRNRDSAEATVSFDLTMTSFYSHCRAADGSLAECGHLKRSSAFPEEVDKDAAHLFRAEEGSDGGGRASKEIRLLLDDGGAQVERVTWCDQAGSSGTVALQPDTAEPRFGGHSTVAVRTVTVTYEHRPQNSTAESLLDVSPSPWLGNQSDGGSWLEFTMSQPVVVGHYAVVSTDNCRDQDSYDWILKGWNDGQHWDDLDSRTSESFTKRQQPRGLTIAAQPGTSYSRFRLEITRNAGARQGQLSQIRFWESALVPAFPSLVNYYPDADERPTDDRGTLATALPGPGSIAQRLRTTEQWRSYLSSYSLNVLRVAEGNELWNVSAAQRAAGWLGYRGAGEEEIAALEDRLGVRLPPSYRAFLGASDGWLHLGSYMWEMRTTITVGWLSEAVPDVWRTIKSDNEARGASGLLGRALLISWEGDSQFWLLDPDDLSEDGEWAAHIWASWYPGLGDRHASFAELVEEERLKFEAAMGIPGRGV